MKRQFTILIFSIFVNYGCTNQPVSNENTPVNGELDQTFVEEDSLAETTAELKFQQEKDRLLSEGWEEREMLNGRLPPCYNYTPQKGKIDNALDVFVGSGTDVVIKVMNLDTEKCIRYIFINSGTSYSIRNIPEGEYYLKIAYGKNWLSKVEKGQCTGKFIRNPMYEKGEDVMDFRIKHTNGGYSVPSFRLQLDVISSDVTNSFDSQNISEDEFNN